jgi:hypothetical protein
VTVTQVARPRQWKGCMHGVLWEKIGVTPWSADDETCHHQYHHQYHHHHHPIEKSAIITQ